MGIVKIDFGMITGTSRDVKPILPLQKDVGVKFYEKDTGLTYIWTINKEWVLHYNPSYNTPPQPTPTLQSVTDAGNQTTNDIRVIVSGAEGNLSAGNLGLSALKTGGGTNIITLDASDSPGPRLSARATNSSGTLNLDLLAGITGPVTISFPNESTTLLGEAPNDGQEYVRKNEGWVVSSGGGSGDFVDLTTDQDVDGTKSFIQPLTRKITAPTPVYAHDFGDGTIGDFVNTTGILNEDWVVVNQIMQAGPGNDNRSWEATLTKTTAGPTLLNFDMKVSTEEDYDYFYVYLNGEIVDEFSGEIDWITMSYLIEDAGTHELILLYEKDSSDSGGDDAVYIDNFNWYAVENATTIQANVDGVGIATLNMPPGVFQWNLPTESGTLLARRQGIVEINEGNGIGYRLKYDWPSGYGTIGEAAVDLTASQFSSSGDYGATGRYSFAAIRGTASGQNSISIGTGFASESGAIVLGPGYASGTNSITLGNARALSLSAVAIGDQTYAYGINSQVYGYGARAEAWAEVVVGHCNTFPTPNNANAYDPLDRAFVVGIGQDIVTRADGLIILKNGSVYAPSITNTLIDTIGAKSLISKEYADANYAGGGGGIPEAPADGNTYGRKDNAWAIITGGAPTPTLQQVTTEGSSTTTTMTLTNTTDVLASGGGALVLSGGLSAAKNIWTDKDMYANSYRSSSGSIFMAISTGNTLGIGGTNLIPFATFDVDAGTLRVGDGAIATESLEVRGNVKVIDGWVEASEGAYLSIIKTRTNAINSFAVANSAGAQIFSVDTINNRVGIGNQTPDEALEVTGNVKATNFIGSGSNLTDVVGNDSDSFTTTAKVQQIVTCTQAEYDLLTPDANTMYVIL